VPAVASSHTGLTPPASAGRVNSNVRHRRVMLRRTTTLRGRRRADTRSGCAVCGFFGLRRGQHGPRTTVIACSPPEVGLLKLRLCMPQTQANAPAGAKAPGILGLSFTGLGRSKSARCLTGRLSGTANGAPPGPRSRLCNHRLRGPGVTPSAAA
jgi:hypothetical protein